jgi:hypothetical protein
MSVQSFRSAVLLAALFTGAATFPSSLSAQQGAHDYRGSPAARVSLTPTSAPVDSLRGVPAGGPRIAPVGFTTHVSPTSPVRPIEDTSRGKNRNVAMMGVGAGAVGLGLIIGGGGGTAIAVTGGVIGLVGLYRYLR